MNVLDKSLYNCIKLLSAETGITILFLFILWLIFKIYQSKESDFAPT